MPFISLDLIAQQYPDLTAFYTQLFKELNDSKGDGVVQIRGTKEAVDVLLPNANTSIKLTFYADVYVFIESYTEQMNMDLSVF